MGEALGRPLFELATHCPPPMATGRPSVRYSPKWFRRALAERQKKVFEDLLTRRFEALIRGSQVGSLGPFICERAAGCQRSMPAANLSTEPIVTRDPILNITGTAPIAAIISNSTGFPNPSNGPTSPTGGGWVQPPWQPATACVRSQVLDGHFLLFEDLHRALALGRT